MNSLKSKITFKTIGLILAVHFSATYFFYRQAENSFLNSLLDKSDNISRPFTIALNQKIGISFSYSDNKIADGLLELFAGALSVDFSNLIKSVEGLLSVQMINNDDLVIAHNLKEAIGEKIDGEILDGVDKKSARVFYEKNKVKVSIPYAYDENIRGAYLFVYSDVSLNRELNELLYRSLVLLIVFLLFGLAFGANLSAGLSSRLKKAAEQVRSFSGALSEGRQALPEKKKHPDEFENFSLNLDEMKSVILDKIQSLENQYSELKEHNSEFKSGLIKETANLEKKTARINDEVKDIAGMLYSQLQKKAVMQNRGEGPKEYISVKKQNRKNIIPVEDISYISVEEHLLTLCFRNNGKWEKIQFFGSLSYYEKNYVGKFVKINRSTLINPDFAQKNGVKKNLLKMEGEEEPFRVSRAKSSVILDL